MSDDDIYICDEIIKKQYEWGILRIIKFSNIDYELIIHQVDFEKILDDFVEKDEANFVDENDSQVNVKKIKLNNKPGFLFTFNGIEVFVNEELFLDEI